MGNWQHDPTLDYSAKLLKQAGTEQYTAGRDTTQSGVQTLKPVEDYFTRLLSGDTSEEMKAIQPEVDVVGQQFDQVRKMISDQPRSGGKASVMAELPVEKIKAISSLLSGAKSGAPVGMESVANAKIGTGLSETGAGLNATEGAAQIGMGGRQQDMASSWKTFFQNLAGQAIGGAGQGAGAAIMTHLL